MKNKLLLSMMLSVMISTTSSHCSAMERTQNEPCLDEKITPKHTKLMYLNDTYLMEEKSKVLEHGKDNKGSFLVLDQTIFYPQGGGQPSDIGFIEIQGEKYKIPHVSFLEGKVLHYVEGSLEGIAENAAALMKVDLERRLINSSAHTSGHLLEAVSKKIAPEIVGMKGYHFIDGPYVEFEGLLSSIKPEIFIEKVNELMSQSIKNNLPIKASNVESDFLTKLKLPTGFKVPFGKQHRIVEIEGFAPVPCGGTHLKNLGELGEVKIKKINTKKEVTKISYTFFKKIF